MRTYRTKFFWALLAALLLAAVAGCRGAESAAERGGSVRVELPPEASAVSHQSDTLRVEAPQLKPAGAGRPTRPRTVERYADAGWPAFEVSELDVSRAGVVITTPTERLTYRPPAFGEHLRLRPSPKGDRRAGTSGADVSARVDGAPEPREVRGAPLEAPRERSRGVFEKLAGLPGWALAALFVVLCVTAISLVKTFK